MIRFLNHTGDSRFNVKDAGVTAEWRRTVGMGTHRAFKMDANQKGTPVKSLKDIDEKDDVLVVPHLQAG